MVDSKQLKEVLKQIDALKTPDSSADYQEGVDDAKRIVNSVLQAAADRERIRQLEIELTELRAKYPSEGLAAPKKRGRKPRTVQATSTDLAASTP